MSRAVLAQGLTLDWQTVIVACVALVVLSFIAALWLTRDPSSHHVRVGLFLERDDKPPSSDPDGDDDSQSTGG